MKKLDFIKTNKTTLKLYGDFENQNLNFLSGFEEKMVLALRCNYLISCKTRFHAEITQNSSPDINRLHFQLLFKTQKSPREVKPKKKRENLAVKQENFQTINL